MSRSRWLGAWGIAGAAIVLSVSAQAGTRTYVALAGRDDAIHKLGRPGIRVRVAAVTAGDAEVVTRELERELAQQVHTRELAADEPGDYDLSITVEPPRVVGATTEVPFEAVLASARGERLWRDRRTGRRRRVPPRRVGVRGDRAQCRFGSDPRRLGAAALRPGRSAPAGASHPDRDQSPVDAAQGPHLQHPPGDRRWTGASVQSGSSTSSGTTAPISCCSKRWTRAPRARASSTWPASSAASPGIRTWSRATTCRSRPDATATRFSPDGPFQVHRNIDLTVDGRKRRGCLHARLTIEKGGRSQRAGRLQPAPGALGARAHPPDRHADAIGRVHRGFEGGSVPGRRETSTTGGRCSSRSSWRSSSSRARPAIGSAARRRSARIRPSRRPGRWTRSTFAEPLRLTGARSCRLGVSRVASDHLPIIADFEMG